VIFGMAGVVVMLLGEAGWGLLIVCGAATAMLLRRLDGSRPAVTLVVAIGLTIFAVAVQPRATLAHERNFFGTLRVSHSVGAHSLVHGRTVHGVQLTAPHELTTPTTYYAREGPLGDVFRTLMPDVPDRHVATLGLGVGTVACYARAGDEWDLFEINPAVVRIATDPRLFVFVPQCTPGARIIVGDARRALHSMPDARYDLVVLDAFTSDAIPAHLLTREAFALYLARLKPGGLLAVHISNWYLDLAPVLAANATALHASAFIRNDRVQHDDPANTVRRTPSTWVVLAADAQRLQPLAKLDGWFALQPRPGFRPWTDDFASLLPIIRLFRPVLRAAK
jgi:SAM-dependent methyltransferase